MSEPQPAESVWEVPDRLRVELLARLSTRPAKPGGISYEDFLDWADEDTLAEWVDGEVVMSSPAGRVHQQLVSFLSQILETYARIHKLGIVLIAPFQMKLASTGREPDILFIARQHTDRITTTYLEGPADLVVEIISPESEGRDRGDKFTEYRDAGIPEYWLVDPDHEVADCYRLEGDHGYVAEVATDGWIRSSVLEGFRFKFAWLWSDPLPDSTSVLLEIDHEAYGRYLRDHLQGR